MALSIGFRIFSFLPSCYSSYGALNFYPGGTFTHSSCQPSLNAHFSDRIPKPSGAIRAAGIWIGISEEFVPVPVGRSKHSPPHRENNLQLTGDRNGTASESRFQKPVMETRFATWRRLVRVPSRGLARWRG